MVSLIDEEVDDVISLESSEEIGSGSVVISDSRLATLESCRKRIGTDCFGGLAVLQDWLQVAAIHTRARVPSIESESTLFCHSVRKRSFEDRARIEGGEITRSHFPLMFSMVMSSGAAIFRMPHQL
jgi:hypothetical protein